MSTPHSAIARTVSNRTLPLASTIARWSINLTASFISSNDILSSIMISTPKGKASFIWSIVSHSSSTLCACDKFALTIFTAFVTEPAT